MCKLSVDARDSVNYEDEEEQTWTPMKRDESCFLNMEAQLLAGPSHRPTV